MVFIAEVTGDSGWPFEDVAIAAIDAEDVDEARDFLVAALMAKNRHLFEAGARRWDETSAIVARPHRLRRPRGASGEPQTETQNRLHTRARP
jgi:hypothetical protein